KSRAVDFVALRGVDADVLLQPGDFRRDARRLRDPQLRVDVVFGAVVVDHQRRGAGGDHDQQHDPAAHHPSHATCSGSSYAGTGGAGLRRNSSASAMRIAAVMAEIIIPIRATSLRYLISTRCLPGVIITP